MKVATLSLYRTPPGDQPVSATLLYAGLLGMGWHPRAATLFVRLWAEVAGEGLRQRIRQSRN